MPVTLRINDIACRYGSTPVLENITFSAASGDFIGVLGPNGSGKTTLLKSISRVLRPHIGTVYLSEKDVYALSSKEVAKNLAVVPQESVVSFAFSALEIVLMGRTPHLRRFETESAKDLKIAKRAMELTNTWYLADRPINELSGGEKQRVIIARALAQEPKVLLLDEPYVHLDINNQIEILNLIKKLTEDGLTVISVFHDLNLASAYCDWLILLHEGKIISLGTPEEVLTPEKIKKVYGVDVLVKRNPITNAIYLTLLPYRKECIADANLTVHLVCGAGSGAQLMHLLSSKGYRVTAGVLNVLDTDFEAAKHSNIPVVMEAPFSPASEESHQANLELIDKADVVVLTNIPFGIGNLKNLEAVKTALENGKFVVVVDEQPIEQRDFTGGKAKEIFTIVKRRATIASSTLEVFDIIEKMDKK
jgi:iron complex transport system ATP-binding protein